MKNIHRLLRSQREFCRHFLGRNQKHFLGNFTEIRQSTGRECLPSKEKQCKIQIPETKIFGCKMKQFSSFRLTFQDCGSLTSIYIVYFRKFWYVFSGLFRYIYSMAFPSQTNILKIENLNSQQTLGNCANF